MQLLRAFLNLLRLLLKLTLWVGIPLALAIGGLFIYTQMKDWNAEAQHLAAEVKKATNRELLIKGPVKFSFFPRPTLTIYDARLDNLAGAANEAFIAVPALVATPSLLSFVTGETVLDNITLLGPVIALEILPDGRKSWDFNAAVSQLSPNAEAGVQVTTSRLPVKVITFKEGTLRGYNQKTGYDAQLSKFGGDLQMRAINGPMHFEGTLTPDNTPNGIKIDIGQIVPKGVVPFTVALLPGRSQITLKGEANDIGTPGANYKAALDANVERSLLPMGNQLAAPTEPGTNTNVHITSDVTGTLNNLALSNMVIDGSGIKGAAEGKIDLSKPKPALQLNIVLSSVDLGANTLLPEGASTFAPSGPTPEEAAKDKAFRVGNIGFGQYYEMNLFRDVDLIFDIGVTAAQFKEETIRDFRLNVITQPQGLEIRNFSAKLPGSAAFEVKGWITDDGTVQLNPVRFSGNVRVYGDNFLGFLKWMQVKLPKIQEGKLGQFAISANAILSRSEVSVPALVARFDQTSITGGRGHVANEPGKPSELSLTMENLNLDDYLPKLDTLIQEAGGAEQEAQYKELNASLRKFDFLRAIQVTFGATELELTVNNLTYKGEQIAKASTLIRFGSGQVELSNIDLVSQNFQMRGQVQVDASNLRPFLNAELNFEDFNTDAVSGIRVFFIDKEVALEEGLNAKSLSERWSKDSLSLDELKNYDGKFRFYFKSLTHQHIRFDNVTAAGHFQENVVTFDNLRATAFDGGKIDAKAVLNIAQLPSLSFSFALSNGSLKTLLGELFDVKAVTDGRFSASGSISTLGYDIRTMVARLEGSVNLILRSVRVKGYDLINLTQQLSKVLSAKQMRDLGDAQLRQDGPGTMDYDYATGNLIISGGVIGMNGLKLLSPAFPPAILNGNVNVAGWEYDLLAQFALPLSDSGAVLLRREASPTDLPINARVTGSIDTPTVTWEKDSIQKYWERRFYR